MGQQSNNKMRIDRKVSEEQLTKPSDESLKESKELVNLLKEKIEKEGTAKLRRNVLRCNIGH